MRRIGELDQTTQHDVDGGTGSPRTDGSIDVGRPRAAVPQCSLIRPKAVA